MADEHGMSGIGARRPFLARPHRTQVKRSVRIRAQPCNRIGGICRHHHVITLRTAID
jgi:hypothetical protein